MAGIRFQTTVYSYNSWSYFIQIWDRNYTGSTISEITLGQGGPQINWDSDNDDRFSTIMSSSCEIPLMVEGTLLENWLKNVRDSYEEKDVYVHIYRNTQATASSLIWSGFLLMDLNSTVDEFFPYEFKLTFTDGLSLLKEVDFVETGATKPYDSSEMLWGPASYSFWMKTVLGKVGAALTTEGAITDWEWRTSINWYNTGHGASAPSTLTFDPFAKTEVQVSMFHNEENDGVYQPQNCYDVLNELLKHWGARIVYWRHKFWIIQIPEYNTAETGTLANPDNINTRKYFHSSNSVSDAFDNLNDYWTPYQVFLQASGVIGPSKIVGTKYDFKAPIKEVIAKYITGSGENYFGGFPTSENTVVTQERINNLADASGIYLDIPLIFTQDRANVNSGLTGGQFSSFSADIRYQLAATNLAHGGSTTKFLHYNYATNTYSWNTTSPSTVNNRPRWYASNLNFTSGSTGLVTQQIGGPDNGSAVLIPTDSSFTGVFDITIQIFNFVNGQASNKYAFIDNDTGANWADPRDIGLTWENVASVSGTTLSSSSYMAGPIRIRTYFQPNGNPFAGQLLALGANLQVSATAQNIIQDSNNTNNSSIRNFDELLWGDSPASVSRGAIEVIDTSGTRTTTVTSGQWGVGVTNGTQTFSKLLLDRFLEGQLTSIRVANFRLVIPTDAKDKDDGTAVRPQYINPVGLLVENRPQEPPMSYVMQRGTFHVLMDEWDFQGFEIQTESTSGSSVTVTDSRGGAIDIPVNTAPPSFLQRPTSSSINSAASNNIITTLTTAVNGLGSDLVTNGNYETDSDWTKGSGWSISTSAKQAQYSGSADAALEQAGVFTEGTKYKVSIDVAEISGGELEVKDQTTIHQAITSAGGYEFTFTAGNTALQLNANTGSVERTIKINSITAQEVSSTTSLAINSIGEAIFSTGDKFSLLNINNNTTYDLTINANQSASDTTLTITSFDFEAIVPVGSIVSYNTRDLVKNYNSSSAGTLQTVTDSGNTTTNSIMIGSSSAPSEKLHVTGDALVTGDVMADTYKPASSSEPIKFKNSSSTELARITDGGNVLIGTTFDFGHKLQLQSNTNPQLFLIGNSGAGIAFIDTDTSQEDYQIIVGANDMVFRRVSDGSDRIRIYGSSGNISLAPNSGNVGIGTTSPSEKLHVKGRTFFDREVSSLGDHIISEFKNTDGTNNPRLRIQSSSTGMKLKTGFSTGIAGSFELQSDGGSSFIGFKTNGDNERMRIDSSGNVGIGLTNPQSKAEIDGTLRVIGQVTPSGGAGLEIGYSGGGKIRAIDRATTTYKLLDLIASNVIIKISGSEKARFDSSGDFKVNATADRGAKMIISGNDTSPSLNTTSVSDASALISNSDSGYGTYFGSLGSGKGMIQQRRYSSATYYDLGLQPYGGNVSVGSNSAESTLDVNGTCTSELLQLRKQDSAPSDPENDRSVIFMDSSGDIKVKINVGGTTVTRTLATYA